MHRTLATPGHALMERVNTVKKSPDFSCSQRTLPNIELITLKWAHVKSKILLHGKGGKRVRSRSE